MEIRVKKLRNYSALVPRAINSSWLALLLVTVSAIAAEAAPFAYVANTGSNTVSVINTATLVVVTEVPVGISPRGVAVSPSGDYVLVTNSLSANVSVIDTATNTVVNTVPVGDGPTGVAFMHCCDTAYVTNESSANVSKIDCPTGALSCALVDTIQGTPALPYLSPWGVAIDLQDGYAYVTNASFNTVNLIDVNSFLFQDQTVAAVFFTDPDTGQNISPRGIAMRLEFASVYVTFDGFCRGLSGCVSTFQAPLPGSVDPMDPLTWPQQGFTFKVGAGPFDVAVYPSQDLGVDKAVVTNGRADTVSLVEATQEVATVNVGGEPVGVATTSDGAFAYLTVSGAGFVKVIDLALRTVVDTVHVGSFPTGVAIMPVE